MPDALELPLTIPAEFGPAAAVCSELRDRVRAVELDRAAERGRTGSRNTLRTPADMLDSPDATRRLATVPFVRTLALSEEVPELARNLDDAAAKVATAATSAEAAANAASETAGTSPSHDAAKRSSPMRSPWPGRHAARGLQPTTRQ
jgi:hypothetical protein